MKDMKAFLFVFGVILFLGIIIPTESAPQNENSYADFLKNITDWGAKEIDKLRETVEHFMARNDTRTT
ncbi:hypothetical protein ALC56_01967 [Trachymyrmex septentrionalis]|uniref:Uncharacterized protein n=1 Tax=Trachymyrmex septentrionalis TaxID=34720 RepID=A0A195FSY7_9HYME|nr:hypothetical protein ALC56_01967 [Trachymyrmex septentrionalis]